MTSILSRLRQWLCPTPTSRPSIHPPGGYDLSGTEKPRIEIDGREVTLTSWEFGNLGTLSRYAIIEGMSGSVTIKKVIYDPEKVDELHDELWEYIASLDRNT